MVGQGIEVIIGTKIDDQFGPVIMYGLGGVMVEILKDVSFRVLPISRRSAQRMIAETKSHPILDGVRGDKPYDKKALVNLLLVCSEIIEAYPQIQEMDLNPVIVHHEGLSIVDARILLKPVAGRRKSGTGRVNRIFLIIVLAAVCFAGWKQFGFQPAADLSSPMEALSTPWWNRPVGRWNWPSDWWA
jgi:acyl-CoA synthetase (NDP forming)